MSRFFVTRSGRVSRPPVRFSDEYDKYYGKETKKVVKETKKVVKVTKKVKENEKVLIVGMVRQLPYDLLREFLEYLPSRRSSDRTRRPPVRFADQYDHYYL